MSVMGGRVGWGRISWIHWTPALERSQCAATTASSPNDRMFTGNRHAAEFSVIVTTLCRHQIGQHKHSDKFLLKSGSLVLCVREIAGDIRKISLLRFIPCTVSSDQGWGWMGGRHWNLSSYDQPSCQSWSIFALYHISVGLFFISTKGARRWAFAYIINPCSLIRPFIDSMFTGIWTFWSLQFWWLCHDMCR